MLEYWTILSEGGSSIFPIPLTQEKYLRTYTLKIFLNYLSCKVWCATSHVPSRTFQIGWVHGVRLNHLVPYICCHRKQPLELNRNYSSKWWRSWKVQQKISLIHHLTLHVILMSTRTYVWRGFQFRTFQLLPDRIVLNLNQLTTFNFSLSIAYLLSFSPTFFDIG